MYLCFSVPVGRPTGGRVAMMNDVQICCLGLRYRKVSMRIRGRMVVVQVWFKMSGEKMI